MLTVRNFFGNVLFISAFFLSLSLFCIPVGASQPDIGSMIDPEDRDIINITGFDSPSSDVRAIFLDRSEVLTLEELTARMPETLSVILNNGAVRGGGGRCAQSCAGLSFAWMFFVEIHLGAIS